jgi:hypothetical protein
MRRLLENTLNGGLSGSHLILPVAEPAKAGLGWGHQRKSNNCQKSFFCFWRPTFLLPPQPTTAFYISYLYTLTSLLPSSSECRYPAKMPRAQAIPDQLRPEIERRILVNKQSHLEVLQWLAGEGYVCVPLTLKRKLK